MALFIKTSEPVNLHKYFLNIVMNWLILASTMRIREEGNVIYQIHWGGSYSSCLAQILLGRLSPWSGLFLQLMDLNFLHFLCLRGCDREKRESHLHQWGSCNSWAGKSVIVFLLWVIPLRSIFTPFLCASVLGLELHTLDLCWLLWKPVLKWEDRDEKNEICIFSSFTFQPGIWLCWNKKTCKGRSWQGI